MALGVKESRTKLVQDDDSKVVEPAFCYRLVVSGFMLSLPLVGRRSAIGQSFLGQ